MLTEVFCMISGLYALCLWTSTDGCVFVKAHQTHIQFLRIGYNDKNNAHVLRKLLHFS